LSKIIIPCNVLDCKHNNKDATLPKCTTAPKIGKDAKCYSVETDMSYLKMKWVHVPGVESITPHKSEWADRAIRGEIED